MTIYSLDVLISQFGTSLLLLSQFPVCWASGHFHCAGFPSRLASTVCTFTDLSFCCAWPLPCWGRAEVASASHIQVMAPDMSVEFVISSVLSCRSKDLKRWTSVTVQLQLRVLFSKQKESTPLRHEGGPTPKERPQSVLASCFYTLVSSPS